MRHRTIHGTITPGYDRAAYGAQEVKCVDNQAKYRAFKLIYDPSMCLDKAEFYSSTLSPTFRNHGDGFALPEGSLFKRKGEDDIERVFILYTARNPHRTLVTYEQWLVEVPEVDYGQALIEYRHIKSGASMSRNLIPALDYEPRIKVFSLTDLRDLVGLAYDLVSTRRTPTHTERYQLKRFIKGIEGNLLQYHSYLDWFVECCAGL